MSANHESFGQVDQVCLSDEDAAAKVLEHAVLGLWDVVNELTRLRRPSRMNYRVTIFGSARIKPGMKGYDEVKHLAASLAEMGCDIISGGGPGLMQAANEGAHSVDPGALQRSTGIRVELPFEQQVNPYVGTGYEHGTFFSRLHHFTILSDAFIVVPGGIGTLLEMSLIWQLLQVDKLRNTPLVLVGRMWPDLVEWARGAMLREGLELAGPQDFDIPQCVGTVEETIDIIRTAREEWLAARNPKP